MAVRKSFVEKVGRLKREMGMFDVSFYRNKKVLVTGHTGFKGTWLCRILVNAGAIVTGYALDPPTNPNLFELARLRDRMDSVIGDIRDFGYLKESSSMSVLNVTTDKVYYNNEWCWGYREDEALDGFDPYSNSKSCSELVTHSYKNCFFTDGKVAVSTARAGNVIGGGDFAKNRIIPDCVRAMKDGGVIRVRNPYSTRPYQHVLEALAAYLTIVAKQYSDSRYQGYYNVARSSIGEKG